MSQTKVFRDQHEELLAIVSEISNHLDQDKLGKSAAEVRSLLSKLFAKLGIHLAMEDKALYPKLLESNDESVKTMAKEFMEEMGGIGEALKNYRAKWPTHFSIEKAPVEFIKETKGIFIALGTRIDRENSQLYVKLDEMTE